MRARCSIWLVLVLAGVMVAAPPIAYAADSVVLAQGTSDDEETQGEEPAEGGSEGDEVPEGQSDPEAETGAEEGETAEAQTETGPPWTFQMGRMALVLTVLLGLAIVRMYYKLVVSRQKGAT